MAWMRKRMTAKGETRWDVEYREPNRRRRRKSFRLKRDAETFRLAIEADLAAGGYVDPNLVTSTWTCMRGAGFGRGCG